MISVVIPTLNAAHDLGRTLAALVPAAVDGIVREVIVVDGGSSDRTLEIADGAGVEIIEMEARRGAQLRAGAKRARFPWLLFLHADTELEQGWDHDAVHFMERVDSGRLGPAAATFRFALDDIGLKPRLVESLVSARTSLMKLPYGDQGLLIPRPLYDRVGGHSPLPLMEDVDLVRKLGRHRLVTLRSRALTSARRYRKDGYFRCGLRNQMCLALYFMNVPAARIARLHRPTAKRAQRRPLSARSSGA